MGLSKVISKITLLRVLINPIITLLTKSPVPYVAFLVLGLFGFGALGLGLRV